MINWTEILIALIGIVFTAVIIPLAKAGFTWLKTKTENDMLLTAISEAEIEAKNIVNALQQTVVDGLKSANEDGKLTEDEAKEVMKLAVHQFFSDVSVSTMTILDSKTDDIMEYIKNLLESKIAQNKS